MEPTVWGGDGACQHDWREHITPAANGIIHAGGMSGETLSGTSATRKPRLSAFCGCGAWRGELGLEPTPELFVAHLVEIFREVRRVLRDDGTLFLNLGDSYCANKGNSKKDSATSTLTTRSDGTRKRDHLQTGRLGSRYLPGQAASDVASAPNRSRIEGIKPKDLIGIPWMVAFALRADGWWLRADNVWGKPNGMPESVRDRTTRSHEYVFLLSKSERYFYDAMAVRTAPKASSEIRLAQNIEAQLGSHRANGGSKTNGTMKAVRRSDKQRGHSRRHDGFNDRWNQMEKEKQMEAGGNLRSVWWISPAQCAAAHFAVLPDLLAAICILAGARAGGCVLDPFAGSGTVPMVAQRLHRRWIGIELNPQYCELIRDRVRQESLPFERLTSPSLTRKEQSK